MSRVRRHPLAALLVACILCTSAALGAGMRGARPMPASTAQSYAAIADSAVRALQRWYDPGTGLWDHGTVWWESAIALEVVEDALARTGNPAYRTVLANTFARNSGRAFLAGPRTRTNAHAYYDDEAWWALAWVRAADLTGNTRYLDMAKAIFADMTHGWDSTCGGGIWWRKDRYYKNAIANELFWLLALRLHERTTHDQGAGSYLDWAERTWRWFAASGLIDGRHLINDGLDQGCHNNQRTTWTYNQGTVVAALVELYRVTTNRAYLRAAETIADAAITLLVYPDGVLQEPCERLPVGCNQDQRIFKGIFAGDIANLYAVDRQSRYRAFLQRNARSIVERDCTAGEQFGLRWIGPVDSTDFARQSSAVLAIAAAAQVTETQMNR